MSLDAMKQALSAIEAMLNFINCRSLQTNPFDENVRAMYALRAAIDQAQEPVAWVAPSWPNPETRGWESESFAPNPINGWIPLYTAPRQWQGLTDAEIKAPIQRAMQYFGYDPTQYSLGGAATIGFYGLAKEIEAKLKEKNT